MRIFLTGRLGDWFAKQRSLLSYPPPGNAESRSMRGENDPGPGTLILAHGRIPFMVMISPRR
jgi:hypothetical protein